MSKITLRKSTLENIKAIDRLLDVQQAKLRYIANFLCLKSSDFEIKFDDGSYWLGFMCIAIRYNNELDEYVIFYPGTEPFHVNTLQHQFITGYIQALINHFNYDLSKG